MPSEAIDLNRRAAFAIAGGALLLAGCENREEDEGEDEDEGVSATEDLMREHGVLRRILVVYREAAPIVLVTPDKLDLGALGEAVSLFQTFGEEYHEQKLEEERIFPALQRLGGEAGGLVATLLDQHKRGREINAFIREKCSAGTLGSADAEPVAKALNAFCRMYEAHTAYEDTIVFQAWKQSMSSAELHEMAEQFEEIEHTQFKGDGFDLAVDQITKIEQRLGLHDLARFTPPA